MSLEQGREFAVRFVFACEADRAKTASGVGRDAPLHSPQNLAGGLQLFLLGRRGLFPKLLIGQHVAEYMPAFGVQFRSSP